MTKRFFEVSGELATLDELKEEYNQDMEQYPEDISFEAWLEDRLLEPDFAEVYINYEEIEGLLTESQNQISFETYLLDGEDQPDEYYDSHLALFTVPYSWYLRYLEEHYTLDDLHEFHDVYLSEEGEDLDDAFMQEYTWDMTYSMYADAVKDNVVMGIATIER